MKNTHIYNTLFNLIPIPESKTVVNKIFKFDSEQFKNHTGLAQEHDSVLQKLDWYFEELHAFAS